ARHALGEAERYLAVADRLVVPRARCEVEGVIATSPVVLRRARDGPGAGDARADVDLDRGACDGRSIEVTVRARVYALPEDLARGDRVALIADLARTERFANPELGDPRVMIARSRVAVSGAAVDVRVVSFGGGLRAAIDHARARVRRRIEATYAGDAA